MKHLLAIIILSGLVLSGCGQKSSEEPSQKPEVQQKSQTESNQSVEKQSVDGTKKVSETGTEMKAAEAGLVCIVTGEEADPEVFTEYNGKKYYFCCEKCQKLFKKNPPKYIN